MPNFNATLLEIVGEMLFPSSPASSLARHLGLSRQYMTKLMNNKAPIPPSLWPDLLRLTAERLTNLKRQHERLFDCRRRQRISVEKDLAPCRFPLTGKDFALIAMAAFGERWTGCMADRLDMSTEYMRKLAKGHRPMREALWDRLELACRGQIHALEHVEYTLAKFRFTDDISCDWDVTESVSSDLTNGGALKPFIFGGTLH